MNPSINSLPVELMLLIFAYFRPMNSSSEVMHTIRSLASVSCRWRSIVINTPGFWTFISLCHKGEGTASVQSDSFDKSLWQAELHLSRSGNLPLTVKWFIKDISGKQMARLVEMFNKTGPLSRWKSLEIGHMPSIPKHLLIRGFTCLEEITFRGWINQDVLGHVVETAPRLRQMRVLIFGTFDIPLQKFPMLSTFSVGRWCRSLQTIPPTVSHLEMFNLNRRWDKIQLQDITHLTLTVLKLMRLKQLGIQNLRHLECRTIITDTDITMPSVQTLVIGGWPGLSLKLSLVRAPKLDILEIGNTASLRCQDRECCEQAHVMLDTIEHQLEPATFNLGLCLRPEQILGILKDMPSVQYLGIALAVRNSAQGWEKLAEGLIEAVEHFEEQQGLPTSYVKAYLICPRLTSLVLRLNWNQDDTAIWSAFALRILRGRYEGGLLQYVRCEWKDGNMINVRH
jgi:F-box-like